MSKKKMTGAEIIDQDMKDFEAACKAMTEETGEEAGATERARQNPDTPAEAETETPDSETEKADSGTETADSETEKADSETEKPETGTEKRDWVGEAVQCFIKDAGDIDPTDPVKAIEAYFQKNATDELKARCKAEGKDAKGCWKFIEEVARKALHGSSGHIDPGVVYAIAMHWFEDVPKDWDAPAKAPARQAKTKTEKKAKPKKPAETPSEIRKEKERMAKAKAKAKAKKPKQQQGFFFEMLETPVEGGQEK